MRRRHVIVLAVVAGALLVLVGAAWGYERAREDTVAEGVQIAGIDVGGLERAAAERKLERQLLDPLQEPIVVRRWKRSLAADGARGADQRRHRGQRRRRAAAQPARARS